MSLSLADIERIAEAVARRLAPARRGFGYVDRPEPKPKQMPNRRCRACGRQPAELLGRLELDKQSYFLGYFCCDEERMVAREAKRQEIARKLAPPPDLPESVRMKAASLALSRYVDEELHRGAEDS